MSVRLHPQLSLDVDPHPRVGDDGYLTGSLKLAGEFMVTDNLQPGAELTVHIASADGEVIASSVAEVASIAFVPIKADGSIIGTDRVHRAKLKDDS